MELPIPYALDNVTVEYIHDDPGIRWILAVDGVSQSVFLRSFMDEIAAATGGSPELRLSLLHHAALKTVLAAGERQLGSPPTNHYRACRL
jgi:hypothetical protein